MNCVNIIGTITKEVDFKYVSNDTAIANFSIAYNDKRKGSNGGYVEKSHFFDVVAFGKNAENIQKYLRAGSKIGITGSLDYQSWQDKNGNNKNKVIIKLDKFDFVGCKANKH